MAEEQQADARLEEEFPSQRADPNPRDDASVEDPLLDGDSGDGLEPWLSDADDQDTPPFHESTS